MMCKRPVLALVAVLTAGCAETPLLDAESDVSRLGSVEVHIETACANFDCTELLATAVVDAGSAREFSWTWTGDQEVHDGADVVLSLEQGLDTLELVAKGELGVATATVAVSTDVMSMAASADVPGPHIATVTILPFGSCTNIPVTNISGCLTGGDPLEFDINGADGLRYAEFNSVFGTHQSTQVTPHAIWSTTNYAGIANGTYEVEYGSSAPYQVLAPAWASHFTFYFSATVPGTSLIRMSHNAGVGMGGKLFATNGLQITCDIEGNMSHVASVPNDPNDLDHNSVFGGPATGVNDVQRY